MGDQRVSGSGQVKKIKSCRSNLNLDGRANTQSRIAAAPTGEPQAGELRTRKYLLTFAAQRIDSPDPDGPAYEYTYREASINYIVLDYDPGCAKVPVWIGASHDLWRFPFNEGYNELDSLNVLLDSVIQGGQSSDT